MMRNIAGVGRSTGGDRTASSAPGVVHPEAENPEIFVGPVLHCLDLARRSTVLLLGGAAALDLGAVLAWGSAPAAGWTIQAVSAAVAVGTGAGLILAAAGVLALIQVRYTFEHAHLHKQHFYDLKTARFHEACAQLKSLSVKDAVGAVKRLQALRGDIAGLDRRLAIETILLRRRLRDLTWSARAIAVLAGAATVTALIAGGVRDTGATALALTILAAEVCAYIAVERWIAERMTHVYAVLSPSPPELSQSFNPSPPLEAAIARLLTRVNRHFDRLNGLPGTREEVTEDEDEMA